MSSDAARARELLHAAGHAVLGTLMKDGTPYTSLVALALDGRANPLLLLSDLAQHARNIARDPRVSVLIDGTAGSAELLDGPRMTLLGRAAPDGAPELRRSFVDRHPAAKQYVDFEDFRLYVMNVERVHLVLGFGHVRWLQPDSLRVE